MIKAKQSYIVYQIKTKNGRVGDFSTKESAKALAKHMNKDVKAKIIKKKVYPILCNYCKKYKNPDWFIDENMCLKCEDTLTDIRLEMRWL